MLRPDWLASQRSVTLDTEGRWVSAGRMRWVTAVVGLATWLLLVTATADARKPLIAYLDPGGKLALYDTETDADVPAPDVTVPNSRYFSVSADGRFVFYRDAQKKLHLYDRDI